MRVRVFRVVQVIRLLPTPVNYLNWSRLIFKLRLYLLILFCYQDLYEKLQSLQIQENNYFSQAYVRTYFVTG